MHCWNHRCTLLLLLMMMIMMYKIHIVCSIDYSLLLQSVMNFTNFVHCSQQYIS
jgi:hypothetical protein